MTQVRLTLSCPRGLGEQIVERLLDSALLPHGFTSLEASGHGADFARASLREKVRGRVDTLLIVAVLPADAATTLLADLRAQFRNPSIRYWTEPVLESGAFA